MSPQHLSTRMVLLSAMLFLLVATVAPSHAQTAEREKLSDDPTKIITKVGFRYSDFATIFGSIAFGPVIKVNVSLSEDEQWSEQPHLSGPN